MNLKEKITRKKGIIILSVLLVLIFIVVFTLLSQSETYILEMPSFNVTDINGHAPNCVIYKNKYYQAFSSENPPETDIIGDYVGEVTWSDTVKVWNKDEYDLELSSNVQRKIYTVKGIDPSLMLCSREDSGTITIFVSLYDIPFSRGRDVYQKVLNVNAEDYHIEFEDDYSYNFSFGNVYTTENLTENLAEFFLNSIYNASLMPRAEMESGQLTYRVYLVNGDGLRYCFALFDNGYVSLDVLNGYYGYVLKLDGKVTDKLYEIFEKEEKDENLRKINRSPYYTDIEWLRDNTDAGAYIPKYKPEFVDFDRATILYNTDSESGRLSGVKDMEMYFMKDQDWQQPYYVINILTKEAAEEMRGHVFRKIDCSELNVELLDDKYKDSIGCINLSISYGDHVVEYQSENIPAEESYKILSSINP